ncbi:MAG: hypothetical protein QOD93_2445 [Acetobacteraceae bacterium]|jgi:hypothetical protein|nr:hypothetical protein [Acetobacteraceae bacterium]MEA2769483.1 hypothetical protein [Acetobacteraceae bacterium]
MTRISSLLAAITLAILPITAFAQQNATPANTTMEKPAAAAAPTNATPSAKTAVSTKDAKSSHAKLGTTIPAAKTIQPSKS